ncbi:MAG TPA: hypothetical protein VHM19_09880, partial [Polyangiales bacterium]|nr:hypothetical protein [Polyangiales bacterium]
MRTQAELERLYGARPAPPRERGVVSLLVVRSAPAKHTTPSEVQVTREHGVVGDRWSAQWHRDVERQITVMMTGAAELVCDGQP